MKKYIMIEEQKITLEIAKLADSKGLDIENCQCVFVDDDDKITGEMPYSLTKRSKKQFYRIPTQSLLQKWLREKHNIKIFLTPVRSKIDYLYRWEVGIYEYVPMLYLGDTYEETLEKGL